MSKSKEKPISSMRPRGRYYSFLKFFFTVPVSFMCNIRPVHPENEPQLSDGAFLILSNHRVWADPVYICLAMKNLHPHFMAKKELFKIPLISPLIRALGAYPVNRGGADVGAIRHTIELLKHGISVGMFPQGHRYDGVDARETPVKNGAAMIAIRAGVPVLPVFIRVKNNKMRHFCKKEIIFGKPITIEEMNYNPDAPGEYQRISEMLFERVCELGDT